MNKLSTKALPTLYRKWGPHHDEIAAMLGIDPDTYTADVVTPSPRNNGKALVTYLRSKKVPIHDVVEALDDLQQCRLADNLRKLSKAPPTRVRKMTPKTKAYILMKQGLAEQWTVRDLKTLGAYLGTPKWTMSQVKKADQLFDWMEITKDHTGAYLLSEDNIDTLKDVAEQASLSSAVREKLMVDYKKNYL